jgi:hypothetical protein
LASVTGGAVRGTLAKFAPAVRRVFLVRMTDCQNAASHAAVDRARHRAFTTGMGCSGLGIVFAIALAVALMTLIFYSNRSGMDDLVADAGGSDARNGKAGSGDATADPVNKTA